MWEVEPTAAAAETAAKPHVPETEPLLPLWRVPAQQRQSPNWKPSDGDKPRLGNYSFRRRCATSSKRWRMKSPRPRRTSPRRRSHSGRNGASNWIKTNAGHTASSESWPSAVAPSRRPTVRWCGSTRRRSAARPSRYESAGSERLGSNFHFHWYT